MPQTAPTNFPSIKVSGSVTTSPSLVAALPAGAPAGTRDFVTDATVATFGAALVGGGALKVPVYSDGTAWKVG
jgi:hypothetical protein